MSRKLENYAEVKEALFDLKKARLNYKESAAKLDMLISNKQLDKRQDYIESLNEFNQIREYTRALYADVFRAGREDEKLESKIDSVLAKTLNP